MQEKCNAVPSINVLGTVEAIEILFEATKQLQTLHGLGATHGRITPDAILIESVDVVRRDAQVDRIPNITSLVEGGDNSLHHELALSHKTEKESGNSCVRDTHAVYPEDNEIFAHSCSPFRISLAFVPSTCIAPKSAFSHSENKYESDSTESLQHLYIRDFWALGLSVYHMWHSRFPFPDVSDYFKGMTDLRSLHEHCKDLTIGSKGDKSFNTNDLTCPEDFCCALLYRLIDNGGANVPSHSEWGEFRNFWTSWKLRWRTQRTAKQKSCDDAAQPYQILRERYHLLPLEPKSEEPTEDLMSNSWALIFSGLRNENVATDFDDAELNAEPNFGESIAGFRYISRLHTLYCLSCIYPMVSVFSKNRKYVKVLKRINSRKRYRHKTLLSTPIKKCSECSYQIGTRRDFMECGSCESALCAQCVLCICNDVKNQDTRTVQGRFMRWNGNAQTLLKQKQSLDFCVQTEDIKE